MAIRKNGSVVDCATHGENGDRLLAVHSFFEEPEEASLVKAAIVADYFQAWSRIMAGQADRIGYLDFYAGPGRYATGEKSTPLLILERAIGDSRLRNRLVTFFNDADPDHIASLSREIRSLPGIDTLAHQPVIQTGEVDDELAEEFEAMSTIPALSFIDPWGYKGLSLRLIRAVVKDWGCEAVFFFNYNRINMGVSNRLVGLHMENLFGRERLDELQHEIDGASPSEREALLRRRLGEALTENGARYLIPFRFFKSTNRASHYICFVGKHELGYSIMKQVMASKGIVDEDGVPLFEYLPPQAGGRQLPFDRPRPLLALGDDLLTRFSGRVLAVKQIIKEHHVGTQFVPANYKEVLKQLERVGRVTCEPSKRKPNTMGDQVTVTFPRQTP